jgi:hypothetical protein
MPAVTQPYGNANAHTATIDAVEYKVTELDWDDGGTAEDVMAGTDGGHGRDLPTSKRTTVNCTVLVPASGAVAAFQAMEEYEATFTKKVGVSRSGSWLCMSKRLGGATASALKFVCSFVSQGPVTKDDTGAAAG